MENKMYDFAKKVIENGGNVDKAMHSRNLIYSCGDIKCSRCIYNGEMNNGTMCGQDTNENYLKISKDYIQKIDKENVQAIAQQLINNTDTRIEAVKECEQKNSKEEDIAQAIIDNMNSRKRIKTMSLKERILSKIDYRLIAQEVFDLLEEEIIERVVEEIDEQQIAADLVYDEDYKNEFIDVASGVLIKKLAEDISVDEVIINIEKVAEDAADEL